MRAASRATAAALAAAAHHGGRRQAVEDLAQQVAEDPEHDPQRGAGRAIAEVTQRLGEVAPGRVVFAELDVGLTKHLVPARPRGGGQRPGEAVVGGQRLVEIRNSLAAGEGEEGLLAGLPEVDDRLVGERGVGPVMGEHTRWSGVWARSCSSYQAAVVRGSVERTAASARRSPSGRARRAGRRDRGAVGPAGPRRAAPRPRAGRRAPGRRDAAMPRARRGRPRGRARRRGSAPRGRPAAGARGGGGSSASTEPGT